MLCFIRLSDVGFCRVLQNFFDFVDFFVRSPQAIAQDGDQKEREAGEYCMSKRDIQEPVLAGIEGREPAGKFFLALPVLFLSE